MIYIEKLSITNLCFYIYPLIYNNLKETTIYFFECSFLTLKILKYFPIKIKKFNFEIRDLRDSNGECIISKLRRVDLHSFYNNIINSDKHSSLIKLIDNDQNIKEYINKKLLGLGIGVESSETTVIENNLFLINKVYEHNKNYKSKKCIFLFKKRLWHNFYKEYSIKKGISLLEVNNPFLNLLVKIKILFKSAFRLRLFYKIIRNTIFYYNSWIIDKKINSDLEPKIIFDGVGEFNLKKDGRNSDFFFYIYSNLKTKYLSSFYYNKKQRDNLLNKNINPIFGLTSYYYKDNKDSLFKLISNNKIYLEKSESFYYKNIIKEYHNTKSKWETFFNKNNTKFYLTWNKFGSNHIAIHDAINNVGGVSAIWDRSFEGEEYLDFKMVCDINFCFSKYNSINRTRIKSKVSYNIITGYLRDYNLAFVKKPAKIIREKLNKNGATLIVAVFDQNSPDEYSHKRERENYFHILNMLIKEPWLGVVFKPKKPHTLRKRLGKEVSDLLDLGIKSGRCVIFEGSSLYQSNTPIVLASEISDICIHGALYAGTAALECAITGKPTLLIDVVGHPYSRLNEFEKDKVIFYNWSSLIIQLKEHYEQKNGIPGFGDWSEKIDLYDPFRDGKGAFRMGNYINSIMEGYENNLTKDESLEKAAETYCNNWGSDKIVFSNN